MDSFYDAPRKPPPMPPRNRLPSAPVVPDISVLCSSNGCQKPPNEFASYNQWKTTQNPYQHWLKSNKENTQTSPILNQQNTSYLKKQVRFESPVLQQRPSLTYEPILPKNNTNTELKQAPDPQLMRFEQMYLANIPNRQLDLSVIDFPQKSVQNIQKPTENIVEDNQKLNENRQQHRKSYKEFKESQKIGKEKSEPDKIVINDSVTDLFNYKRSPDTPVRHLGLFQPNNPHHPPSNKMLDFPKTPSRTENLKNNADTTSNGAANYDLATKYFPTSSTSPKLNFDYSKTPERANFQFNHKENLTERTTRPYFPSDDRPKTNFALGERRWNEIQTNNEQNNDEISKHSDVCECNCTKNTDNKALTLKNEDEPSVRDLLKIIAQQSQQIAQQNHQISLQNEQLLNLQKQVTTLITNNTRKDVQIADNYVMGAEAYRFTNVQETPRKGNKRGSQKFSIDFTTSVSFRGNFQNKNPNFVPKPQENFGPKIEEITESSANSERSDNKTLVEHSMVFREPIEVRESCPSPEPSIKIDDMKDFEDSDAEDSDSDYSDIGPSFYKNLMAQVNNVLHKAQIKTTDQMHNAQILEGGRITNKTIHKVKEATMRHLRSIGVSVPEFDETTSSSSSSSEENRSYDKSDVSFAVKQLLMKYLPDEHLAKVANKEAPQKLASVAMENVGAIKARPDFSFATVQYMKKYNLIAGQNQEQKREMINAQTPKTPNSDKILDISRLKQQPKLI